jgi:hypothetical protein
MLLIVQKAEATHIRAGEIIARRVETFTLTYEFTFIGYRDTDSGIQFGGGVFDFGDGTVQNGQEDGFQITETQITSNIVRAEFTVRHTFEAPRNYIVSYTEDFRNAGIANMDNSVNTAFYTETLIVIDPFFGINNTPILTVPPIDEGIPGVTFVHNPGAFDIDGDSLSYEFVTPRQSVRAEVNNYRELIDPSFYTDYAEGAQGGGTPTLTLDRNGNLTWNSPGDILTLSGSDCQGCSDECSEYNVAFRVVEWKKRNGVYRRAGYVTRDMQIIVYEGDNQKPELEELPDACVVAGNTLQETILGTDPDGHDVKIEAFGGPFELNSPATVTPGSPPVFQPIPATVDFEWNTICGHVRARPYEVQLKITDQPNNSAGSCEGPPQVDFITWQIQVIGPKPQGLQTSVSTGRSIDVSWDPYSCPNADSIQIWRRVGDFAIPPDSCVTGMPAGTGYELIDQVSAEETSYLDEGLAPGAKYCYRIVATFPAPADGQSVVSDESCVTLETDAPVITNVSVVETSQSGSISVRWTPPYEVDQTVFPPPYTYNLYRSPGFFVGNDVQLVGEQLADTTFTDTGINTSARPYSYCLTFFDNAGNFVDSSAVTSSVRLEATPLVQAIEINWRAEVPWSNIMENYPYHYIYRDQVDPNNPQQLVLIDSVLVTQSGFMYLDEGQFNGELLDEELEYCYYITTQGSYDNPLLPEPLINDSQQLCAQPNDDFAPCPPLEVRSANAFDCAAEIAQIPCDVNTFENVLAWEQLFDNACDDDAIRYRIYFSATGLEEDYELIDSTTVTTYTHSGLSSFKGCYRISAVDRSLNESPLTEPFCIDNCPNFFLPNAFSPNGDGKNDRFTPYYSSSANAIDGFDLEQCPRFIKDVDFKVFDRSGKEVFDLSQEEEQSILINWDGRTNDGRELASGVYFYVANVTFDVLATSDNQKTYKGWVQLLR